MGKIEPNLEMKKFGLGDGWITVTPEGVSITVNFEKREFPLLHGHDDFEVQNETMMLDPELAPLFRMVANRLDELSGKRKAR